MIRMISEDGSLFMMAADTTEIVKRAQEIHNTTNVCTAALGRLLTGAAFMGQLLKGKDSTVTLVASGKGPCGNVTAVADSLGNVRGYIAQPRVELPLNSKGKLDVGRAVGTDGFLYVVKNLGMGEPYSGQVPLVSGEIAEDITSYFASSEQTPTVCALGVLTSPSEQVLVSGGFLIQLLPTADDETISAVERCISNIRPVTTMLSEGLSLEEICQSVLSELSLQSLGEYEIDYRCNCSRERVEKALLASGREALAEMAEDEKTVASCDYCGTSYVFTQEEIKRLAAIN